MASKEPPYPPGAEDESEESLRESLISVWGLEAVLAEEREEDEENAARESGDE